MTGIPPSYEQKTIPELDKRGTLRLVASPDGVMDSVTLHADARLYAGLFNGPEAATLALNPQRKTWVQMVRGQLDVNGHTLQAGDGAAIEAEAALQLSGGQDAEVLVFDLDN